MHAPSLWLWSLTLWAFVGSACARPKAEHPPQGALTSELSQEASIDPVFQLGNVTYVANTERSSPITETPVAPPPSKERPRAARARCHLNPRLLEHTIREQLPSIRSCYERESRRDPTLAGKVTIAFVVQPDGRVRDAEAIQNSTGSAAVAACVSHGMSRVQFGPEPTRSAVSCVYPFLFGARR